MISLWDSLSGFARVAPWVVLATGAVVLPVLLFIPAPYGRYYTKRWGPALPARWGWVVMEAPSLILFGLLVAANPAHQSPLVLALAALWLAHYTQRTLVYPFLMKAPGQPKPWLTVAMAIVFNVLNGVGNGWALVDRPFDAAFVAGSAIFAVGFVVNLHADAVLRGLRKPGETGYSIPQGGLYRFVTSPNYLGELLEWLGFALAAQTLAGWAFAFFTLANLLPRALAHHRWYHAQFPGYPRERRALVPFVL